MYIPKAMVSSPLFTDSSIAFIIGLTCCKNDFRIFGAFYSQKVKFF
jgi:hypothetical protein